METPTKSFKHPWICILTYFTLFLFLSPYKAEAKHKDNLYTKHCSSVVPEAHPDQYSVATTPFASYHRGYYNGGDSIRKGSSVPLSMYSNALTFKPQEISKTDHAGVVKVEANLQLRISDYEYYGNGSSRPRSSISFSLEGFWSESSAKLCMVGSTYKDQGDSLDLSVVLKMNNVSSTSNISTVFTGTLKCLNPGGDKNYFDMISLMMFPQSSYNYGLVSGGGFDGGDLPQGLPPPDGGFCAAFRRGAVLSLNYEASCTLTKNCTPFVKVPGFLPSTMFLIKVGCQESPKKLHVLLRFSNTTYFENYGSLDPRTTLVGEGAWDENNKLMHLVACQIMTRTVSFDTAYVGDCSINLVLVFPAIWSIKERNKMVGRMWSKKEANDSGYFPLIQFKSDETYPSLFRNSKYRYTKTESINKLCPKLKQAKSDGHKYPNSNSQDLGFRMSFKNSRGTIASGYATPLFVGNKLYQNWGYGYEIDQDGTTFVSGFSSNVNSQVKSNADSQHNISYTLDIYKARSELGGANSIFNRLGSNGLVISAEGVYDEGTGYLCMVGCGEITSNGSMDCNILINLQFPPINSMKQPHSRGSIQSTRARSDHLYFETVNFISKAYYTEMSSQSMWRLDLELTLVLISNTLSCILVGLQLLYVRKHPEVLPFASLVMLVILTLGYMIPLVLNFEAWFLGSRNRENVFLERVKLLEVNEIVVRLATMVAFLLQSRLLQLTWLARKSEGNRKDSWKAEKKALLLALPLYAIGALAALLLYWRKNPPNNEAALSSSSIVLKRYAGFILDGFLLPQILLNMFRNSKEKILSNVFFVGTTLIRLVPHGYDLYRSHNTYVPQYNATYFYGNPGGDYYSTSWDVIIPLGGLVFAAIVYLQQRFGGRCILPERFRGNEFAYDKVAVVDTA